MLVVTIGICALPALYAWFNIYANWDPYNNTGNIRLAAAIEDAGWTDEDGTVCNLGEEVRKDLEESKSISWVFVDSDEAARVVSALLSIYAVVCIALLTGVVVNLHTKLIESRMRGTLAEVLNKVQHLSELSKEELDEISEEIRRLL